jgi:hypothetical protein
MFYHDYSTMYLANSDLNNFHYLFSFDVCIYTMGCTSEFLPPPSCFMFMGATKWFCTTTIFSPLSTSGVV